MEQYIHSLVVIGTKPTVIGERVTLPGINQVVTIDRISRVRNADGFAFEVHGKGDGGGEFHIATLYNCPVAIEYGYKV